MTIAGLDPSGGAGIVADIKTIAAFGCFPTAALTSITFQNTSGVFGALHQTGATVRAHGKLAGKLAADTELVAAGGPTGALGLKVFINRPDVWEAIADEAKRHGLPIAPFRDLLSAFRQDVTKLRYANWNELLDYCRYSAMPVGRFVLDVHGESRDTWPANDLLCAALQIINPDHDYPPGQDPMELAVKAASAGDVWILYPTSPAPGQKWVPVAWIISLSFKSEGETVTKGEPLYELDTDKVTQEVESDASGVLLRIAVAEGEVEVGRTIALVPLRSGKNLAMRLGELVLARGLLDAGTLKYPPALDSNSTPEFLTFGYRENNAEISP